MPRQRFNTWSASTATAMRLRFATRDKVQLNELAGIQCWTKTGLVLTKAHDIDLDPDMIATSPSATKKLGFNCSIDTAGRSPEAVDPTAGVELLANAIRDGELDALRQLLQDEVTAAEKVNTPDPLFGSSGFALHYAVERDSVSCARTLLEAGALVDASDDMKQTALHACVLNNGSPAMMELLYTFSADPNAQDTYENTPLMYAVLRDNYNHTQWLLQLGAATSIRSKSSGTAVGLTKADSPIRALIEVHDQYAKPWNFKLWRDLQHSLRAELPAAVKMSKRTVLALLTVERRLRMAEHQELVASTTGLQALLPYIPQEIWHLIFSFLRAVDFLDWTKLEEDNAEAKAKAEAAAEQGDGATPGRAATEPSPHKLSPHATPPGLNFDHIINAGGGGRNRSSSVSSVGSRGRSNSFLDDADNDEHRNGADGTVWQPRTPGHRARTISESSVPSKRGRRNRTKSFTLQELLSGAD